jgi:Rab3 GTPase-activating protein catalytic subunit
MDSIPTWRTPRRRCANVDDHDDNPNPLDDEQQQHSEEDQDHPYTDYSCSTNLERLARDIETIFHAWHVHSSDRHFSSGGNGPLRTARIVWNLILILVNGNNNNNNNNNNNHSNNNDDPKRRKNTTIGTSKRMAARNLSSSSSSSSSTIPTTTTTSVHASVELDLTLWDGPPPSATTTTTTTTTTESSSSAPWLPFGLRRRRRRPSLQVSPNHYHSKNGDPIQIPPASEQSPDIAAAASAISCMDNFSSLFDIGQYITLTPATTTAAADNSHNIPPNLLLFLTQLVQQQQQQQQPGRPTTTTTTPGIAAILTQWLQTALNMAAAHSECQFPVFGVWATTTTLNAPHPGSNPWLSIVPSWAMSMVDGENHSSSTEPTTSTLGTTTTTTTIWESQTTEQQRPYTLLSGRLVSTEGMSGSFSCSVWPISIINPKNNHPKHLPPPPSWRWTTWGDVLLRQCGSDHDGQPSPDGNRVVHMWQAQHTYVWYKQRPQRSFLWEAIGGTYNTHEWRSPTVQTWKKQSSQPPPPPYAPDYYNHNKTTSTTTKKNNPNNNPRQQHAVVIDLTQVDEDVDGIIIPDEYRKQCQRYALRLLEHAAGATSTDPMWGPSEDPVEAIHVILTWMGGSDTPLFTLPLRARPTMSQEEYDEMEEATESAILDPHRPNASVVRVLYDGGVAMAAQAATQRCALAALIRTATLPKETLLPHLVDETMLDQWDGNAGNKIAEALCKKANVDAATRALVAAMDWTHAAEDTIERWQAEDIVKQVFNGTPAHGFPSPPDNIIHSIMEKKWNNSKISRRDCLKNNCEDENEDCNTPRAMDTGYRPFAKAAPPGRLVSLLFTHMARVRSPSSVALVWLVFVQELRRRLHSRESLPNMNFVPGLDPPPHTCSNHTNSHFANVGVKANLSGQIYSSEPDPDSCHCLIGQKLQVRRRATFFFCTCCVCI